MSDLVTLICPSCGGSLQVSSNTSVLNCQHCGIEHLVRRDAGGVSLESFARCPKCGRNDRVEKISAILRSHKQEVTTTEKHTESYIDQYGQQQTRTIEVPITKVQYTGLAKSFTPPGEKPEPLPKPAAFPKPDSLPKPESLPRPKSLPKPKDVPKPTSSPKPKFYNPNNTKTLLIFIGSVVIIASVFLLILAIAFIVNEQSYENIQCCGLPLLLLLIGGIATLILGITKKTVDDNDIELLKNEIAQKVRIWEEENELINKKWIKDVIEINTKWQQENKDITAKWEEDNEKVTSQRQQENERIIEDWENRNKQLFDTWKEDNRLLEESWQKAMNNWNNLYFCHRDDCVFVEGDNKYARIEDLESYLYKDLPKPKIKTKITSHKQQSPSQKSSPLIGSQQSQTIIRQNNIRQNQQRYLHQSHSTTINRCPICGSRKVSTPKKQNMSCIWLIFIFFSMGLGLIFWFFTPKYVNCLYCGAQWKV